MSFIKALIDTNLGEQLLTTELHACGIITIYVSTVSTHVYEHINTHAHIPHTLLKRKTVILTLFSQQ